MLFLSVQQLSEATDYRTPDIDIDAWPRCCKREHAHE
jgi:hypothetical protein